MGAFTWIDKNGDLSLQPVDYTDTTRPLVRAAPGQGRAAGEVGKAPGKEGVKWERDKMKIKIISDGTSKDTKIVNAITGELIDGITEIIWRVKVGGIAKVNLKMLHIPIELVGERQPRFYDITAIGDTWRRFRLFEKKNKITIEELIEWDRNKKEV